MGDSREASPDWLRSFKAPTQSITTLSSDSEPSSDKSPARDDSDTTHRTSNLLEEDGEEDEKICDIPIKSHTKKSPIKKTTNKRVKVGKVTPAKRKKSEKPEKRGAEDDENVKMEEVSDKSMEAPATAPSSVCELSSDSESHLDTTTGEKKEKHDDEESAPSSAVKEKSPKKRMKQEDVQPTEKRTNELSSDSESYLDATISEKKEKHNDEESAPRSAVKRKSPKKRMKQEEVQPTEKKRTNEPLKVEGEVDNMDVAEEGKVSSSTLPLVLPDKVHRSKALVECEGESIELSGDMGAVGRVIISETPSKESEMFLDLKGTIYKTIIVPSRTFCVVSVGQSEAKIEAIMNDFIQLKPQSNVYNAETMVEGTLEGFTFDSDDEADKMTKDGKADQKEGSEEKSNKKTKGKAEKKPAATKKKGKDAGGKKPIKRKPQAPKKGKAKK
ncbi:DNA-binding protein BIN4 isoform X2 [Spinacia oleracea]|uniref:DNA-binding protein BIN4 isoform X2 n=1 Tax=Spinacia oleracea TaxID=3562 RepID=A0ABM3RFX9_SPIOL|nr:DNA-binding protein BIN4 isoform X2 [Spinacia oleracea]